MPELDVGCWILDVGWLSGRIQRTEPLPPPRSRSAPEPGFSAHRSPRTDRSQRPLRRCRSDCRGSPPREYRPPPSPLPPPPPHITPPPPSLHQPINRIP